MTHKLPHALKMILLRTVCSVGCWHAMSQTLQCGITYNVLALYIRTVESKIAQFFGVMQNVKRLQDVVAESESCMYRLL